jgi:hypothetical protein
MRNPFPYRLLALLLASSLGAAPLAQATSMKHRTIVDLIDLSELIVVGEIVAVQDGFEGGVPHTEVTVQVSEALKGNAGGLYTFRQFGLRAPRDLSDGRTYVGVSPDGWPTFETGQEVVLFLYQKASKTGLRTTVGLLQGKFTKTNGRYVNGIENRDLFRHVSAAAGLLTAVEEKMLAHKEGPLPAETFVSLVRKAVRGHWVEERRLHRVR